MANPLEVGMVSPPAPNQDNGNALQQGGPQQPQSAPPPPSHDQTVAALRHFDAIKDGLTTLLKDPSVGKANVKSKIIDGVTNLVSERMMKPAEAVILLSQVPDNPLDQRKWLTQQMTQTMQAERVILSHHAMGFAGQGPMPTPSRDDHMDSMSELNQQYGQK